MVVRSAWVKSVQSYGGRFFNTAGNAFERAYLKASGLPKYMGDKISGTFGRFKPDVMTHELIVEITLAKRISGRKYRQIMGFLQQAINENKLFRLVVRDNPVIPETLKKEIARHGGKIETFSGSVLVALRTGEMALYNDAEAMMNVYSAGNGQEGGAENSNNESSPSGEIFSGCMSDPNCLFTEAPLSEKE